MICDFCQHEIANADVIEARNIRLIPAWCNHCGAFSNGKEPMRLPHIGICLAMDRTYEEARQKKEGPHLCNRPKGHEGNHECVVGGHLLRRWLEKPRNALREKYKSWHLGIRGHVLLDDLLKVLDVADEMERVGNTYRDTLKAAQENGTNLWNKVVRVKNLLRVAQPYLEKSNWGMPEELELAALCNEIEKEIGSLEDNTTEKDGATVAERLGIDIEKWAEEIRAKVDAAAAKAEKEKPY